MDQLSSRQKKKNDSDEKILASAIKVFGTKGYNATSLTEIAAGAGVSQSLVSQRFVSKDNLVLEAFRMSVSELVANCEGSTEVPGIFYSVLDWLKIICEKKKSVFAFLSTFASTVDLPDVIIKYAREDFKKSVFNTAIKDAQEKGILPKGDARELYLIFFRNSISLINWYKNSSIPFPDNSFFLRPLFFDFEKTEHEEDVRRIQELDSISRLLVDSYSAVYYCDTKTDGFVTVGRDIETEKSMSPITGSAVKTSDALFTYADMVLESDRYIFEGLARDLRGVTERHKGHFERVYQRYVDSGELNFFLVDCLQSRNDPDKILVSFSNIHNLEIQRREQYETLRRQNALLNGIAREYLSLWLLTPEKKVILFNDYEGEELRPKDENIDDFTDYESAWVRYASVAVDEKDRQKLYDEVRWDALKEKVPDVGTYVVTFIRNRSGKKEYCQVCFAKSVSAKGKVGYVMAFRNADEQIRREIEKELSSKKELEEALRRAETASMAKTDFLFNVSRNTRTPVNDILGYADLARRHVNDEARVSECLERIGESGEYLLGVLNDLLDMSSAENGQLSIVPKEADIYRASAEFRTLAESMANPKSIKMIYSGDIKNRYIYADVVHIKRCASALVSNAVQFSDPGSTVELGISQSEVNDEGYGIYCFTVKDHGIGISEEFLGKIFEPFAREFIDLKTGTEGLGLGLSTTKKFVEAMNGTIEVDSTPGKGSTFTVTLPLKVREHISTNGAETMRAFENKKLLLAEDNELNRELTKALLEDKGFAVDAVSNGREAADAVREKGVEYYSAILMDLQMPVMDGYESAKAIRKMYPESSIPIIAVSASSLDEDRIKASECGMNAHIAKPIRIEELYEAVINTMSYTMRTDVLTHVKNRMAYEEDINALNRAIIHDTAEPFALVMCDVNNLKESNDTLGHDVGDEMIREATKLLCGIFKSTAVYRIGGDEFVAILKGSDYENRELLMKEFEEETLRNVSSGDVVVAFGMSEYTQRDKSVSDVFRRADINMYETKERLKSRGAEMLK